MLNKIETVYFLRWRHKLPVCQESRGYNKLVYSIFSTYQKFNSMLSLQLQYFQYVLVNNIS